jgi:hypothetical protein
MNYRNWAIIAGMAILGVAVVALPLGFRAWDLVAYARQRTIGAELVEGLRDRRPETVSAETWEHATSWVITAYHNICFSHEQVPLEELAHFIDDAQNQFQREVDLQLIDWVWARLAETGTHGRWYVEKFESEHRANVSGN